MGEGLKVDKVRDATFLITGAGTWVGKAAYLTTIPMTIQGGKKAIAQAISDNRVKARGQDIHMQTCQPNSPSSLTPPQLPHQKMCLEIVVLTTPKHPHHSSRG